MKRKKKATKSNKASRAIAKLPVEIRRYIKGKVVDISSASEYHKKSWEIYRPLLGSDVSERGKDRYRLSDVLYGDFLYSLNQCLSDTFKSSFPMKGGDWIAEALCYSAYKIGRAGELDDNSLQDLPMWDPGCPVSDAWDRLGNLPVPPFEEVILEEPKPGSKWRQRRDCGYEPPKVRVSRAYSEDRSNLPTLTIELEGQHVCTLMKASSAPRDPDDRQLVLAEAKRLWDSVVKWLKSEMGLGHFKVGRPKTGLGWEAAFLHDHMRLSWSQVGKRLCPVRHKHTKSCIDNYHQQAKQYWKRIEKTSTA